MIDLSAPAHYSVFTLGNPDRVVIDLDQTTLSSRKAMPVGQGPVHRVRSGPRPGNDLRIVLDTIGPLAPRAFNVAPDGTAGNRLVVEFPARDGTVAAKAVPLDTVPLKTEVAKASSSTASMPASVVAPPMATSPATLPMLAATKSVAAASNGRDLVVAIDAGHGGEDPGAIGRGGTREKHVTLAIARKLAQAIDREHGMRAVLMRDGDTFVEPAQSHRARRASTGADMFVSIHADSVRDRSVGGSSVYVLSTRGASDEAARWLAERENAADLIGGVSLDDKNDVLASVLLDVTQKESVSNSVEAASTCSTRCAAWATCIARACSTRASWCSSRPTSRRCWSRPRSSRIRRTRSALRDRDQQQRLADAIHYGRARLLLREPAAGHAARGVVRGAPFGGCGQPAPSPDADAARVCYPRDPLREAAPRHAHPGPARPADPPDRRRRGHRAPGVRGQGAGREQPRCRRALGRDRGRGGRRRAVPRARRRQRHRARRAGARARAPCDQQDRAHRGSRVGAHARVSRRGAAEHRIGVARHADLAPRRRGRRARNHCGRWRRQRAGAGPTPARHDGRGARSVLQRARRAASSCAPSAPSSRRCSGSSSGSRCSRFDVALPL